jgi:hypothetical protein
MSGLAGEAEGGDAGGGEMAASRLVRKSRAVLKRRSGERERALRTTESMLMLTWTRWDGGMSGPLGRSPVSIS